jgi:hypothetical protein
MKHATGKSNIDIIKDYVAGVRPFTQVGYVPVQVKREIGEEWTDSHGVMWRQEQGFRTRVNRQADLIRAAQVQKCKCGRDAKWGSRLDRLFYAKTGLCENCLIDYETKLHILGIYGDYEMYKMLSNQLAIFKEAVAKIEETIKFFSQNSGDIEMICNAEGFTERWKNTNRDEILKNAKADLKLGRKRIAEVTREKTKYKKKYIKAAMGYKLEIYAK